jgi:prepilin-type N-terminal cleavage/methylation domain-containing protein/prepilin-type processing-associated H-X9-DG protein
LHSRLNVRAGFTLIEILICVAILVILLALLLPAAHQAVGTARAFKCQMSQRSVAFDFGLFADDSLHPSRGDDDLGMQISGVPKGQFRLETFIESQYGLDEFWFDNYGNAATMRLPDANGRDPMRCAEVKGDVTLQRATPCTQGAVNPPQNISFGFNERLERSWRRFEAGNTQPIGLSRSVLDRQNISMDRIPLLWDVDGAVAASRNLVPLFSAPALDATSLYVNNTHWFPGMRHNGAIGVAFIDGHVATSRNPLGEPQWDWDFDPTR